jgi:hypothetical protein
MGLVTVFFVVFAFYIGVFVFAFKTYLKGLNKVSSIYKESNVFFDRKHHRRRAFFDALIWPYYILAAGVRAWWNDMK